MATRDDVLALLYEQIVEELKRGHGGDARATALSNMYERMRIGVYPDGE